MNEELDEMKHDLFRTWRSSLAPIGVLLALGGATPSAHAQPQLQLAQNQGQATAPASLQVSGSSTRFTVSANRADVQDVLKLVFDQAGKQFLLDNNVTGQVTLLLNGQPLDFLLNAICQQTFLAVRFDAKSGVYRFTRDEEAIKNAIARLNVMNAIVRAKLRGLGLEIPNDAAFGAVTPQVGGLRAPGGAGGYGGNGLGGGGGFGGTLGGAGGAPNGGLNAYRAEMNQRRNMQNQTQKSLPNAPKDNALTKQGDRETLSGQADIALQNAPGQFFGYVRPEDYPAFIKENGMVTVRVPKEKPEPVSSILLGLAKQANVTMLLDPSLTNDNRFRFVGTIPPRPLPDALNLLSYWGRLEWRWVGATIYVTPAPDFTLFFSEKPVVQYQAPVSRGRQGATPPQEPAKTKPEEKEKSDGGGKG